MNQQIITTFDYEALDAETRIVVQQKTGEIKERVSNIARNWIEIGHRLSEVKAKLPYKQWGKWLEAEFGWSQDTAENWMRTGAWLDQNPNSSDSAKLLPQRVLYLLSGKSIPESARDEVLHLASEGEQVTAKATQQIVAAHKAAPDTPLDWSAICKPDKVYVLNWIDHFIIDEVFDTRFDAKHAYPLKNHRPESGAYIIAHPEVYNTYTLRRPASADDSDSSDLSDSPMAEQPAPSVAPISAPEPATPLTAGDTPANEGQALHAAGIDDSTSPDTPRHDPRQVSNTGEWTPGETAYIHRAQAAVNHAHPGKMPYVGKSAAADELERLHARVLELGAENDKLKADHVWLEERYEQLFDENETLRAENARLVAENIRLRAETVNLRNLAQLPDVKQPPAERML